MAREDVIRAYQEKMIKETKSSIYSSLFCEQCGAPLDLENAENECAHCSTQWIEEDTYEEDLVQANSKLSVIKRMKRLRDDMEDEFDEVEKELIRKELNEFEGFKINIGTGHGSSASGYVKLSSVSISTTATASSVSYNGPLSSACGTSVFQVAPQGSQIFGGTDDAITVGADQTLHITYDIVFGTNPTEEEIIEDDE